MTYVPETARDSFEEAVRVWLDTAAEWLTAADEPAATALLLTSRALDKRMSGPLLAQYGLMYRHLMKRFPDGDETDPLDALLNGEK